MALQRCVKGRPWLNVAPPALAICITPVKGTPREDLLPDVLERPLVESSLLLRHFPAKIDDPFVTGAAGDVHAVAPWAQHIRVWLAVRVEGQGNPSRRQVSRNFEGAALRIAHESHILVFDEPARP